MNQKIKQAIHKLDKMELGKYHVWVSRLSSYLGPLNFAMILYMFVIKDPAGIAWYWWVLLGLIGLPSLLAFDILVVYPSALRYSFVKNSEWVDKIENIEKILEEMRNDKISNGSSRFHRKQSCDYTVKSE